MDCALSILVALLAVGLLLGTASALDATVDTADKPPLIDFAVVGQQKCGTSSLWHHLSKNPVVRFHSGTKETFLLFWDRTVIPRCDAPLEDYIESAEKGRNGYWSRGRRVYLGDFTSTHFACPCCPATLKLLNPGLKVIIMLRDPVFRAHSRFVEQVQFGTLNATLPTQPRGYAALANTTSFVQYVDWVLTHMEACLQRAQLKPPALARHLTMQCYLWDHVIGYSVYDIFLLNYLEHFPDKQVLVVYMEDLAAEPLRILEQVEAHIGVPHHQYNTTELAAAFNARGSYGWGRGSMLSDRKGSIEPSGVDQNATAVLEAVERLRRFFAPSVQRLFALADEGRITRAPQAWRARYGSAAFSKDAPPATPQNASAV